MNNLIRLFIIAYAIFVSQLTYAQPATFYRYYWSKDGSRFVVEVQNNTSVVVTVYNELWYIGFKGNTLLRRIH